MYHLETLLSMVNIKLFMKCPVIRPVLSDKWYILCTTTGHDFCFIGGSLFSKVQKQVQTLWFLGTSELGALQA